MAKPPLHESSAARETTPATISPPPSPACSFPHDQANPLNWASHKKWLVTLIPCYITLVAGLNATSLTAATSTTNAYFHISDADLPHSLWPMLSWNLGAALAPMLALPLMENYGMRPGYVASYVVFTAFVVPQALARDFVTLVSTRAVAGAAAGVLQDALDGIIADVWGEAVQRSLPVTVYVFALLAGVSLGPVLGGAVMAGGLGWRWIFYLQLIIYGASFPLVLLFKETRGPVILAKRKTAHRRSDHALKTNPTTTNSPTPSSPSPPPHPTPQKTPLKTLLYTSLSRPTTLLLTEPVVLSFTLLSALSYGLLFLSTQSIPLIYSTLYDFNDAISGLLQIGLVIGEALGFLVCLAQNRFFARAVRKVGGGDAAKVLETRLWVAVFGCFVGLAGGLFMYGATTSTSLPSSPSPSSSTPIPHPYPYALPTLSLLLLGLGSTTTMQAIMIYITDAYASHAGSASAAVCFGENVFAALLPLASNRLYGSEGLGFRWASWTLGFVALGLGAPVVGLLVWGGRVRGRSRYMLTAA